ncbi:MAG: hypothetical protein ACREM6_07200 [Vulcanimicrobiaceae bacterium]
MVRTFVISAAALAAMMLPATVGLAAPSAGLAYDSVMKFQVGADPATLQPGTFAADFATASAAKSEQPSGRGGLLGHMKAAIAAAKSATEIFHNGSAEHVYVAGLRRRTDVIATQSATILDCSARSETLLDMAKKTYRVVSLDAPSTPADTGSHRGSSKPEPAATDDGSRYTLTVATKALGPETIEGTATSGYSSDITMTVTRPSGESQTSKMLLRAYYAATAQPQLSCYRGVPATAGPPGQAAGSMAGYGALMRALSTKGDSRFHVTSTGPALPVGRLALFETVTFSGQRGSGVTIETERGNVRPVAAADPVFSVPSDYTRAGE